MEIFNRRSAFAVLALSAAALTLPTDASAQRVFSFAYDQPKSTAYGIAGDIFDAKLKELSGGKMSVNQFPNAQLGQEPVMLQKVRTGDIDFVITSTANASKSSPAERASRCSTESGRPASVTDAPLLRSDSATARAGST